MSPERMQISVLHPRSSERFEAEIAAECPARVVLASLQRPDATPDGPFLEPAPPGRPYALVHVASSVRFGPDTTMAEVGVSEGDVLEVRQDAAGAGS